MKIGERKPIEINTSHTNIPLTVIAVTLVVMWVSLGVLSHARYVSHSSSVISMAFAIGNAMPIIAVPMLYALYAMINQLKKKNAEQQNQIDELKRELEERRQTGDSSRQTADSR